MEFQHVEIPDVTSTCTVRSGMYICVYTECCMQHPAPTENCHKATTQYPESHGG